MQELFPSPVFQERRELSDYRGAVGLSGTAGGAAALATGHGGGSVLEHSPDLIAVGVGFVAFMWYLVREQCAERGRALGVRAAAPDGRQWVTVSLLVIAGIGHLPLIASHLAEAPYMGALFIAFVIAAFTTALALALRRSSGRYAWAGCLCAGAVVAYVVTRLLPLPQLSDDVGAWLEPLGVLCVIAETAVVALAAVEVRRMSVVAPSPDGLTAT